VAPEGRSLAETNKNLDAVVKAIQDQMQRTGIKLLWGTANLFSNPRYMHGAATSCNADAFAFAAAQVKKALEVTKELGGAGYVFWGGREGYQTLWNTHMKRELDHLARFMHMAVDYAKQIGFSGQFYFEPKPKEPTKHQYDFDTATVYGFLKRYGLEHEVKVNIEVNHATLSGHSFEHEVATACALGLMGSLDANRGDEQLGWDTDQFPNNHVALVPALHTLIAHGGFTSGGMNFDARVRHQSLDPADLMAGHIGGLDTLARAFLCAAALHESGELTQAVQQRYAGWDGALGQRILAGASLESLSDEVLSRGLDPRPVSGRQERLENLVNRFV
jgi:xylose isomerase